MFLFTREAIVLISIRQKIKGFIAYYAKACCYITIALYIVRLILFNILQPLLIGCNFKLDTITLPIKKAIYNIIISANLINTIVRNNSNKLITISKNFTLGILRLAYIEGFY